MERATLGPREYASRVHTVYIYAMMVPRCQGRVRPWWETDTDGMSPGMASSLFHCDFTWNGRVKISPLEVEVNTRHSSHVSCLWKTSRL